MNSNETLALLKEALSKAGSDATDLQKAWTQSGTATSGLTYYDLEAPAKSLFPVITPLRNEIPRVSGKGGIQANWRAVTGINTTGLSAGVSEGNRGGLHTSTTADYLAAYRGLGLEDSVTFEADYAARGFDDVKAIATQNLLRALMIQEERIILGGNGTNGIALGTTPTPTLAAITTGGSIADSTTVSVICVALTHEGFMNASMANGVQFTVVRTNADSSVDTVSGGAAQKSAAATQATGTPGTNASRISATVTAVRGAYAYAWYAGTAGNEKIAAITTINSVIISALPGSGQAASVGPSADHSKNTLVFDGLLTFAVKSGNGGYYVAQATGTAGTGTPLTADASGGISEFDTALQWFWDTYRLSPSEIWVSSQEMNYIRKKVLTGSSNAAQRFVFTAQQNGFMGGSMIKGYSNPFTMGEAADIPIRLHPNMPAGTVLFVTKQLPYPLSGVTNVNQIRTRQEYYSLEWPMRSRKYEYGVYCDEVLQCYAPFSLGAITNIAAG